MSDARLRALAREVALTGGLDARVRLLVERARAGDLPMERLRLAAYLRDPAARRALAPGAPRPPTQGPEYLAGLAAFGVDACLRAAVAVGRVANPDRWRLRELLDALTLWLECPCGDHVREVARTARLAEGGHPVSPLLLWAATVVADRTEGDESAALSAWRRLWKGLPPRPSTWDDWEWNPTPRPRRFVQDERHEVRRALEARLVPWALG